MPEAASELFFTGLPHYVGQQVLRSLLHRNPLARATLLVRGDALDAVDAMLQDSGPIRERCRVLVGDVAALDLGLAGDEWNQAAEVTTDLFHFASSYHLGVDKLHLEEVNISGTRHVLEFARDCSRLRRLNHYSSAFVAGARHGVILEDELERGQAFRNTFERTRFTAEFEVRRAARDLPITVYRPGLVVGDSRTGEIDRLDGPYFLVQILANAPERLAPPASAAARFPFHVSPADFVAEAICALSSDPLAVGRTVHLVDPNPVAVDDAFRLISELAEQRRVTRTRGDRVSDFLRRVPFGEEWVRASRTHLDELDTQAVFNTRTAGDLLRRHAVVCPFFTDYAPRLVSFAQRRIEGWREEPPRRAHSSRSLKAVTGRTRS